MEYAHNRPGNSGPCLTIFYPNGGGEGDSFRSLITDRGNLMRFWGAIKLSPKFLDRICSVNIALWVWMRLVHDVRRDNALIKPPHPIIQEAPFVTPPLLGLVSFQRAHRNNLMEQCKQREPIIRLDIVYIFPVG